MRRGALLGVLLLAGCGGSASSVVTVTVTKAAAPQRSCTRIVDSPIQLCELRGAREYTTAFFATRRGRLVALPIEHPPGSKVGHWVTAFLSPDRKTLLAQWSAECEVPIAYFVAARGGVPHALSTGAQDSIAHGWTVDGRAIVDFPSGPCGATARQPGLYLVSLDGSRRLVAASK